MALIVLIIWQHRGQVIESVGLATSYAASASSWYASKAMPHNENSALIGLSAQRLLAIFFPSY